MNVRDFDILAAIPLIALLFTLYEIGGLTLPGWHTISFFASHNPTLKLAIQAAFLIAGLSGAIWFGLHATPDHITK